MMFWSISVVSEYLSLPSALCAIGKQLLIHNLNHIDRKNILYLVQYHDLRWIRIEKFLDSQMLIFSYFKGKYAISKPKGLKVAKEDQRSIGSMVNGLDG